MTRDQERQKLVETIARKIAAKEKAAGLWGWSDLTAAAKNELRDEARDMLVNDPKRAADLAVTKEG